MTIGLSTHRLTTPPLPLLILLACLSPLLLAAHYIRKDYHTFLALGPGGTPSTPTGYARICILRLLAIRNPLAPPSLPPPFHPQHGILRSSLPARAGPRPHVAGIAPHRQTDQKPSCAMSSALSHAIHQLVAQHPGILHTATSCFEKHSTGIFCAAAADIADGADAADAAAVVKGTPPIASLSLSPARARHLTCNGEVCHSHPSDGSLHLTLHPADVGAVLEKGWGERHPLAWDDWSAGWWWLKSVPPGFVMIYAPRDEHELGCVLEIIRAAVWWVSGTELGGRSEM